MRPAEVETWVLRVLDGVVLGTNVEDDRVELKTSWPPDTAKAARRIAAHANTARGESILWIIGADEKGRAVPGAEQQELANWWPRVSRHFDGLAPSLLHHIVVPFDGRSVVALAFDTARAPYVVTNPSGGGFDRDVPWRDGARTRSAKREELLRTLAPLQRLPHVETMDAEVQRTAAGDFEFFGSVYVTPVDEARCVFPFHRLSVTLIWEEHSLRLNDADLSPFAYQFSIASTTIAASVTEVLVHGPGRVSIHARGAASAPFDFSLRNFEARVLLGEANSDRPIEVRFALGAQGADPPWVRWSSALSPGTGAAD